MKIYFDKDINYAEFFFRSVNNYGVDIGNGITQFRDENTSEVVGYGFENASQEIFRSNFLSNDIKDEFYKIMKGG